MELKERIREAINCASAENGSDTPDFILAEYLTDCLAAFDKATTRRTRYFAPTQDGKPGSAPRSEHLLCDEDCNHCPLVIHPNTRLLTALLNQLHDRFGEEVYRIVETTCPNLTCCADCHIDDFCHVEGCEIAKHKGAGESPARVSNANDGSVR